MAETNITQEDQEVFQALISGQPNGFALFSCFRDGIPSVAIVHIVPNDEGGVDISPLFVKVDDGMVLTDHDGRETETL
jgi:hypothetical protein